MRAARPPPCPPRTQLHPAALPSAVERLPSRPPSDTRIPQSRRHPPPRRDVHPAERWPVQGHEIPGEQVAPARVGGRVPMPQVFVHRAHRYVRPFPHPLLRACTVWWCTDDDAAALNEPSERLGEITLEIYDVRIVPASPPRGGARRPRPSRTFSVPIPEDTRLHETSKKAGGHRIQYVILLVSRRILTDNTSSSVLVQTWRDAARLVTEIAIFASVVFQSLDQHKQGADLYLYFPLSSSGSVIYHLS